MKYFFTFLLLFILFSFSVTQVKAVVSEDETYRLREQTVDILPYRNPTSKPTPTSLEEKPLRSGTNFVVTTTNPEQFSFTINNAMLDYDKPEATVPVIRTSVLTVSSSIPYLILASQDQQLSQNNRFIPNTTCDNGSCSETLASLWKNNLTYGLGFRCDSITHVTCAKDFQDQYYRPFATSNHGKEPQIIMQGIKGNNTQGKITYKLVISGTQPAGFYRNTIQYIAVPGF